jgi:hypothetical protein
MTWAWFMAIRSWLDEFSLVVPATVMYIGDRPDGTSLVSVAHPQAMMVRHLTLETGPEPFIGRTWNHGSLLAHLRFDVPRRWRLATCAQVGLYAGKMALTMHDVPLQFFAPGLPGMLHAVVIKRDSPLRIECRVSGLAALVRLFFDNRVSVNVVGQVAQEPGAPRIVRPSLDRIFTLAELDDICSPPQQRKRRRRRGGEHKG